MPTVTDQVLFPPGYMFKMGRAVWNVYRVSSYPAYRVCIRTARNWDTAIERVEQPITLHVDTISRLRPFNG